MVKRTGYPRKPLAKRLFLRYNDCMEILQIILGVGAFGIIGFILYWFGVILKVGPKVTQDQINKDTKQKE